MKIKRMLSITYFSLLYVLFGIFKIAMPFNETYTLLLFLSATAGILIGKYDALIAVAIYLAIGLLGLPVFPYVWGVGSIFEPHFGFLISMALCSFMSGFAFTYYKTLSQGKFFICLFGAIFCAYAFAAAYFFVVDGVIKGVGTETFTSGLAFLLMLAIDGVLCAIFTLLYPKAKFLQQIHQKKSEEQRNPSAVAQDEKTSF